MWLPELAHLPTDALLDSRMFTNRIRESHDISELLYPLPVCTLQHAGFKGDAAYQSGTGAGGGATNTPGETSSTSGGGKSTKPPRMKKNNHGGVPGNKRMIDMNALVIQHTSKK